MSGHMLEIKTAIEAAVIASDLCRRVQRDLVGDITLVKPDRSPVTIADFGSQAIICRMIRQVFPKDNIVAEEDAAALRQPAHVKILEQVVRYVNESIPNSSPQEICSWIDDGSSSLGDRFWTLDPIDGTKGFLRGDQYAIALALIEEGVVTLGLLACPRLHLDIRFPEGEKGCLFLALRGKGAFQMNRVGRNKRPISVSRLTDPSKGVFTESVEMDHSDHELHERLARRLNITKPPLQMDGQTKYGLVARGEALLYLRVPSKLEPDYREKIWDHAAGTIVTEEAGGRVTDALGRPLDFASGVRMDKNYGIVVSNGILHEQVLTNLRPLPDEAGART